MEWNLLIVDDEPFILETLERLFTLQDNRFQVKTFSNPILALEWIKGHKVHIVLSDIKMPKMSGDIFLKEIKRVDGHVQVIMMTGYSTLKRVLSCFESGANDYILKPFDDLKEVIKIVNYSLDKLERWKDVIYESRRDKNRDMLQG